MLSVISEQTLQDTLTDLNPAIQAQVILPLDAQYQYAAVEPERGRFRFLHDRMQHGAYNTIDAGRKAAVHLNIGRLLLANTPEDQREEHLFTIVNHLNAGRALLVQPAERIHLAELNLRAGRKAKASAAFQLAFTYVTIGSELLPETCWEIQYSLTFALYREQYECAYLTGNFERANQLSGWIVTEAKSTIEKSEIYNSILQVFLLSHRISNAMLFFAPVVLDRQGMESVLVVPILVRSYACRRLVG